jgi:cAMP phosphodiesterase
MERIDFGNSYILGQSIKSGAVYLLHRKKSNIKSMLKTRDDYRKEILEELKVSEKGEKTPDL